MPAQRGPVDDLGSKQDTVNMTRAIALLRGINVGGHNKLPMADLRSLFTDLGCTDVATYIQSGNVVFDTSAKDLRTLGARATARIESTFGLQVPVQTRTGKELAATIAAHPFTDAPGEEKLRNVMFLETKPTAKMLQAFEPNCSFGEVYEVIGRELHVLYSQGQAKSKFTHTYVERVFATASTTRNWRTVTKLLEMLG